MSMGGILLAKELITLIFEHYSQWVKKRDVGIIITYVENLCAPRALSGQLRGTEEEKN